ncbi:competence protein CoiA family protein [Microcoleus sp. B4-D4]|uniref:competence protein CoiA family protein n=1 Tax=Microcoleus sp. B4-D4 TaxID=2818667 RepID=UPI002FCF98C4
MWLRYGVAPDKTLVSIEDVPRGKTQLRCPYCGGELAAKKGQRKEHHFAHTNESCREVAERSDRLIPTLPLYDDFNIWLTGKELQQLKTIWNRYGSKNKGIPNREVDPIFIEENLLEENEYRLLGKYQFTKLGKIPVGALSLMLFNQVQEPLLLEKHQQLEENAEIAYQERESNLHECLSDLQIYRAGFKKILLNTLYYLQIDAGGETIYKIGVTGREIEERVAEIKNELAKYFQHFTVKVLGIWAHRGNVEKYFKHRYAGDNFTVGSLTEYYKFHNPKNATAALRDLRRMKEKELSEIEVDILAGRPSSIERIIEQEERADRRSNAIKKGMERAIFWGQNVGRPSYAESTEHFLEKPSSQRAIAAINEGLSLRQAAEKAGVSVNTVRKVKAILDLKSEISQAVHNAPKNTS